MRWRRIEALARRMAAHDGRTRALLQARLQALRAELASAGEAAAVAPPPARPAPPLGALLAAFPASANDDPGAPQDLKVVQRHRAAWTQLRAELRVAQTQSTLPEQAGPLNSQRLLHRALAFMQATAPAYLQQLTAQAEALMWLEHALAPAPDQARDKPAKAAARGRGQRAAPR